MSGDDTEKSKGMAMKQISAERDKYFSKPTRGYKKQDDLVAELVQLTAAGIGIVSEANHHRKAKKMSKYTEQRESSSDSKAPSENTFGLEGPGANPQADMPHQTSYNEFQGQSAQPVFELEAGPPPPVQQIPISSTSLPKPASQVHALSSTSIPVSSPSTLFGREDTKRTKLEKKEEKKRRKQEDRELAKHFIARHPCPTGLNSTPRSELALPVILPQRRPKVRERGFARAYAPMLADSGVDEASFLDFIDTFNKSFKPNQYLYALDLVSIAGTAAPEPFAILIDITVGEATAAAVEASSRYASNEFLNAANEGFFAPRGLACFVVTYNPDSEASVTDLKIAGPDSASRGVMAKVKDIISQRKFSGDQWQAIQSEIDHNVRANSGTAAWMESAPLVFPSEIDASPGDKKKNVFDRAEKWLDTYQDKTAQSKKTAGKYQDHPMSQMLPKPQYMSRYADPDHPAASGDVVALLTGGRWQYGSEAERAKEKEKQERKEREKEMKALEKEEKKAKEREAKARKEEEKKAKEEEKKAREKEKKAEEKQRRDEKAKEKKSGRGRSQDMKSEEDRSEEMTIIESSEHGRSESSWSQRDDFKRDASYSNERTVQPESFNERWPAYEGKEVVSVSGEASNPNPKDRKEEDSSHEDRKNHDSVDMLKSSPKHKKKKKKDPPMGVKSLLHSEILYLVVVNRSSLEPALQQTLVPST